MADRYWVGGTADWNTTAGTKWATTSGGAGGASVPTASDNAYFDANSGGGTVTVSGSTQQVNNLTLTGYTGTLNVGYSTIGLAVCGNMNTGSTCTITQHVNGGRILMYKTYYGTPVTRTITTNGLTLGCRLHIQCNDDTIQLADNFLSTEKFYSYSGTFDADTRNITCKMFDLYGGTITMGSGTWAATSQISNYCWLVTGATITCETSTINYTGSDPVYFDGENKTYYNLQQSGTAALTITGSNTFNNITIDAGTILKLTAGTTQTIASLTSAGSAAGRARLLTTVTDSTATLTDSGGTNDCDYLSISDIVASGGATFNVGYNSLIFSGCSGWSETGFENPANVYADDANYATGASLTGDASSYCTANIQLSKDGGTTWTSALGENFYTDETSETYGAGSTELWGTTFTGADITDANFRLKITTGADNAIRTHIFKDFGFSIDAAHILTGIEVVVKAKWNTSTYVFSLNNIKIKIYYGTSTLPIQAGSQAYASDGIRADGSLGVMVYYDGTNWVTCDTGEPVIYNSPSISISSSPSSSPSISISSSPSISISSSPSSSPSSSISSSPSDAP